MLLLLTEQCFVLEIFPHIYNSPNYSQDSVFPLCKSFNIGVKILKYSKSTQLVKAELEFRLSFVLV